MFYLVHNHVHCDELFSNAKVALGVCVLNEGLEWYPKQGDGFACLKTIMGQCV